MSHSMHETASISTGLYPKLDLWNTNILQLQLLDNLQSTVQHYVHITKQYFKNCQECQPP